MTGTTKTSSDPNTSELDEMHAAYRRGGQERQMAPHVVYADPGCPHPGCGHPMRAIDFRLELHGKALHDPLVRAWWDDTGFVGRCPACRRWVHFTIQGKRAVTPEEADRLPKLPDNWHDLALIL